MKNSRKIPKIIYIYLYFYGLALVSSGRDLDASKRASEDPNPKKRMLGPAPSIFCRVDVPKTPKQVSLATPKIYLYVDGRGAEGDKKRGITFLSDIKRDERAKRQKKRKSRCVSLNRQITKALKSQEEVCSCRLNSIKVMTRSTMSRQKREAPGIL